ncbi:hypothetical protein [Neptuniibacter halophilus]|nr:hypothetical protein [Neptuniibacter halophilus]
MNYTSQQPTELDTQQRYYSNSFNLLHTKGYTKLYDSAIGSTT